LLDEVAACDPGDIGDRQGDQDCIVDLAGDGNEVWNDVERQSQVGNEKRDGNLRATRNARIAHESLEQYEAVGDEARNIAGIAFAPEDEKQDDQGQPQRERRAESGEEPEPDAQAATARRASSSSAI